MNKRRRKILTSPAKQKGNRGENIICKFLTEQFEEPFTRIFGSGAYLGGKNQKRIVDNRQNFEADILAPSSLSKLRIESKFYKDFPFHKLLQNKSISLLDEWIEQAKIPNTIWFLVMRFNRKGGFILYENNFDFLLKNHCIYNNYIIAEFEEFIIDNKNKIREICA